MRPIAVLLTSVLLVTSAKAQVPLTLDTSFRFYYTPELMDQWETTMSGSWLPAVSGIVLRLDGNRLIVGGELNVPNEIPWGNDRSVVVDQAGIVQSYLNSIGGLIAELPATNQYFATNKRWNYDCTVDFSFGLPNFAINDRSPESWVIFEDRSALVAGYFKINSDDTTKHVLVKVDEWGEWDESFSARWASGPNVFGKDLFPLSNGQYLFNGSWSSYEGRPCGSVVRIQPGGAQDTTFTFHSPHSTVATIYEQPDGKVILGGQFLLDGLSDTLNLVRLNIDGSLDLTFNNFNHARTLDGPFSAQFAGINVLVPLDNQRYVIGGKFTRINAEQRGCIACVDTAGNLLDCWAGGGLVPSYYSPNGYPYVYLAGLKRLANGETNIYGQYQGFIDSHGLHSEQVLISRMHWPAVSVIEHHFDASPLRIWPNPSEELFQFSVPPSVQSATVTVRGPLGQVVHSQIVSEGLVLIHTTTWGAGLYTVELFHAQRGRSIGKWLKQ